MSLTCLDWSTLGKRGQRYLPLGLGLLVLPACVVSFVWWRPASLAPDIELSIEMLALVTSWIAAFLACFGAQVARSFLFPLGFLFGLVPMPQAVVDVIIKLLQVGSAVTAYLLFAMAGVPVSRNGVLLTIPSLTVEVAKECSSIRSSLMLIIATIVLAHLFLKSPWRKVLVVAIAIPLSVAKNGLRIFTIVMLGTRVDPGYLTGRLHHQGGVIFLAVSLLAVGIALWIMHRTEAGPMPAKRRGPDRITAWRSEN
jgi:exosortase